MSHDAVPPPPYEDGTEMNNITGDKDEKGAVPTATNPATDTIESRHYATRYPPQ